MTTLTADQIKTIETADGYQARRAACWGIIQGLESTIQDALEPLVYPESLRQEMVSMMTGLASALTNNIRVRADIATDIAAVVRSRAAHDAKSLAAYR